MFEIASRDFDLTDAIKEEIESLQPMLTKHMQPEGPVKVTLSKASPTVFHVHMQARYMGEIIISDHESHNFHKALELCKDHFVKQVDKRREKVKSH